MTAFEQCLQAIEDAKKGEMSLLKKLAEMSAADPMDQRLRGVMTACLDTGTPASAAAIFGDALSKKWYIGKAAEKMLHLRYINRWHIEVKGKPFISRDLLADFDHCVAIAEGLKPMPVICRGF